MPLYAPKNFDRLIGTPGFSDELLRTHFELYKGYVKNTAELHEHLETTLKGGKTRSPEYAELKRRFAWEFNGMRLHEIYFENMTRGPNDPKGASALREELATNFGTFETWSTDFKATGGMRGIGWAALFWDATAGQLFNAWINEHDGGHFAGCPIVLLMDVFEHAFMRDYGTKRNDYIEAFFGAIDWKVVEARFTSMSREAALASRI